MNRRIFFRNLVLGIVALPAAIKVVGKNRLLYFDDENSYLKTASFKMDGTHYFLPGVSGNYASVPDSSLLRIQGDIEWVVFMQPAKSC